MLKNQSRIQKVFSANLPVWAPKLCGQNNEKQLRKNLILSNFGDLKSLLQLYLSIVRILTLRCICFNTLYVTFQPVFTSNFERTSSVRFKHLH